MSAGIAVHTPVFTCLYTCPYTCLYTCPYTCVYTCPYTRLDTCLDTDLLNKLAVEKEMLKQEARTAWQQLENAQARARACVHARTMNVVPDGQTHACADACTHARTYTRATQAEIVALRLKSSTETNRTMHCCFEVICTNDKPVIGL